jgi:tungstate transport system substrate-binding protein
MPVVPRPVLSLRRAGRPCAVVPVTIAVVLAFLAGCGGGSGGNGTVTRTGGPKDVVLATTTELRDSGLLDTLVPAFEASSDCSVTAEAHTARQALALGRSGAADVLLVDSPAAEERFMAAGDGTFRVPVLHDGFLLVGPRDDPAGAAKGGDDVVAALRAIAAAKARFLSRADGSGLDVAERAVWRRAGTRPAKPWYVEAHADMPHLLQRASKAKAYALADRATYVALQQRLGMRVITQGGDQLLDPYSVTVAERAGKRAACAKELAGWLDEPGTQSIIGSFGVGRYGDPLFLPDAPTL